MNKFQIAEPPGILPRGVGISHMTRMLQVGKTDTSPETRWRWGLLEIATDTLMVITEGMSRSNRSIWKEEARLRASDLLQLALIDSFKAITAKGMASNYIWDHRSVAKLAHSYRSLHQSGTFECAKILRDTCFGLAAAYRPVVPKFDLQLSLRPTLLSSHRRRALVLFTSFTLQRSLERASGRRSGGTAWLKMGAIDASTTSLLIQTSDPITTICSSCNHQVAAKLAAELAAESVCRHGADHGSILELRFKTNNSNTYPMNKTIKSYDPKLEYCPDYPFDP